MAVAFTRSFFFFIFSLTANKFTIVEEGRCAASPHTVITEVQIVYVI